MKSETAASVLRFWFEELAPDQWFARDTAVDALIGERFAPLHRAAAAGELFGWRASPEGRLAEVLILDQFTRNLHRDSAAAFACDGMALALAQEAVARGADRAFDVAQRAFLYMPHMHCESALIHDEALRLFTALGSDQNLEYERRHKAIIDRFGRYPHRNALLCRPSTPDEIAFLEKSDSSF